ncbi:MAG: tetratricopeptide repeat protein [Elusimicrobia bacterium]|nr:tetratricopeptide repeat protein [Elusimicrobiota bacterium]
MAVLAAALLACPAASYAAFDDLGFGARAPGMGDVFTGVADDISSVHYNPAGLSNIERPKALATHSLFHTGLSDGSNLGLSAAAFALPLSDGRSGTLAAAWEEFSLSGVYFEKTGLLSWGYRLPKNSRYEKFSLGASLKYLSHGFTRLDEAYNAVESNLSQNGATDPVLAGNNSVSAVDADLGALYRLDKRWTLGAAVLNAMQANVAFGDQKDQVPMKMRAGASFKSLWLLLAADARLQKGPDGKLDKQFIFAAEKVFPSLDKGEFGIRGSLGAGDREFKQGTLGFSYKIQRIQFDYGFMMPIGTLKETTGNHRLALTYHFGSPTQSELAETELLDQYKRLREAENFRGARDTASLDDPRLAQVKEQVESENFYAANKLLVAKAGELLPDSSVVNLTRRLAAVAAYFPSLSVQDRDKTRSEQLLSAGVQNFLRGRDIRAMKQLAYAQSLNQQDSSLSNFLDKAGEIARIAPDRVPNDFSRGWPEYKMSQSDDLYAKKKYAEALRKLEELLDIEPNNLMALKKSGSCDYMLNFFSRAMSAWEKAMEQEKDPDEKGKLGKMIEQAKSKRGQEAAWEPEGGAYEAPEAEQQQAQTGKSRNAREIEKLYQAGADYYAKGDYGKAADAFRKILTLDPQNAQAKKALERIIRLSR